MAVRVTLSSIRDRCGVLLRNSSRKSPGDVWNLAKAAEESGLGSIWLNEHVAVPVSFSSRFPFTPDGQAPLRFDTPGTDAMVTLGFLAAVTTRIRLGTAVIPMTTRDPLTLAKQAATVDLLSNGRLELGIGTGWLTEEAELLGHPTDQRRGRMAEAIEVMRLAWSQSRFSYSGRFYQYPEIGIHPQPPQGRGIPIWVGGMSPAAARLAVQAGAGLVLSGDVPVGPDEIAGLAAILHDAQPTAELIATVDLDAPHPVDRALALVGAGADRLMLASHEPTKRVGDLLRRFASNMAEAVRAG